MTSELTMKEIREIYPFKHRYDESEESRWFRAEMDMEVFQAWEDGRITGKTARDRLTANNGWAIKIGLGEFKIMANSLGYFRGIVPPSRKEGIYGDTDVEVES